jgi:hypothetical protein
MVNPPVPDQPAAPAQEREQLTVVYRGNQNLRQVSAELAVLLFVAAIVTLAYRVHLPVALSSSGTLAQRSWDVLGFSAAIGLTSAAILQVAKQVFGLRSFWQRRWVVAWIEGRCGVDQLWRSWLEAHQSLLTRVHDEPTPLASADAARAMAREQAEAAYRQLQTAVLGAYAERDLRRVFDLPTEQLCALLSTAADYALTSPHENAELLLAFSGPTGLGNIDRVAPPRGLYNNFWIDRSPADDETSDPHDDAALGMLAHSVRSGLDVLQASIGQQWSRAVRTWAVAISGVLGAVIVLFIRLSPPERILFALAALLLGGFFAWLFRDLTAVVERARR